jgi:ABC-type lipoprotein release transport system permease subunit
MYFIVLFFGYFGINLNVCTLVNRLSIVEGLQNHLSFTVMASTGQLDLQSKHAEQLLGFVTIGCSSNHSRTPKVQASTHFLQPVQRQ